MQVIKHLMTGLILLIIASCIDPFRPGLTDSQMVLVINGLITDHPGVHTVEVSRSVPFDEPSFWPVRRCLVQVYDGQGSSVEYSEDSPGRYTAYLDNNFIGVNKTYRLYVQTPDGSEYFSEYDSLLEGPDLSKLYYEKESQEGSYPGTGYNGIQFYLDVKGSKKESGNLLWKLEETYEYTASHKIQYIWDGKEVKDFLPSDSLFYCYKTKALRELYTASTRYLDRNILIRYPLTYVSDQTNRLWRKYSLLVRQYSLTENAFNYWNNLNEQLSGRGGLIETQPYTSEGNIFNIDDPYEKVLGIFYASQVKEIRTMVISPFTYTRDLCLIDTMYSPEDLSLEYPYLVSANEETGIGISPPYGYAPIECFDCRLSGGTTEKPDYWDE